MLPAALDRRLNSAADAVCVAAERFLSSAAPQSFRKVVDRNASLRFHDACQRLSFYSTKMNSSVLSSYLDKTAGDLALLPFTGQLPNAKMRGKCFVSVALETAEVRNLLAVYHPHNRPFQLCSLSPSMHQQHVHLQEASCNETT